MKINKHIQIVCASHARHSAMGQKSARMIRDTLSRHYEHVGITTIDNQADLQRLVDQRPDLLFLGLKRTGPARQAADYSPSDDTWVSDYLDERRVSYTGSTRAAIALDLNKNQAKRVVQAAGLPTAPYFMASPGEYRLARELPMAFPLFVKPPTQGGGRGIGADSITHTFLEYEQKVEQIHRRFGTAALVETYLEGREFSVALLGSEPELLAMPIELVTGPNSRGDRILSSQVKAADSERAVAVAPGALREQLIILARNIYRALGARDYGRIDIRMDARGNPYFLEANLVPGVADHDFTSYFTTACLLNEDLGYEAMILKIVATSLERSPAPSRRSAVSSFDYHLPLQSTLRMAGTAPTI